MSQVSFKNEEVWVIVDAETRSLRKNDKIYIDEEEAWEVSRDFENAVVTSFEEYLKEIE